MVRGLLAREVTARAELTADSCARWTRGRGARLVDVEIHDGRS
jgi:hypothetical protein